MTSSEIKHVPKRWGHEKWIVNTPEYCGKLLFFNEGKRCSWHYHKLKDETFYLQSGKILLYYGDTDNLDEAKDIILEPGDKFHIYRGLRQNISLICTLKIQSLFASSIGNIMMKQMLQGFYFINSLKDLQLESLILIS